MNARLCDLCGRLVTRRQRRVVLGVCDANSDKIEVGVVTHGDCMSVAGTLQLMRLLPKLNQLRQERL